MRRHHLGPLFAIALAACGGSSGGGGSGGSGGTDGSAEACEQEPGQGLSQPCCLAHGVDACGAALFCAAFDGRKAATCYAERSRLDRTSCGEDRHCVSGSCNVEAGLCRSLGRGSACDPAIGCAPDLVTGAGYACLASNSTCAPVGDGTSGSVCELDSDCPGGACISNTCIIDESICGGGGGTGPCAVDPSSEACFTCRAKSIDCVDSCSTSYGRFFQCVFEAGCVMGEESEAYLDVACGVSHCDEEFCDHEKCANRSCKESNCY